jgi:hypothetical protein
VVAVGDDVWLAGPHEPKAFFAELPEGVAADNAVDAVGEIAGQHERVFVLLNRGVGAAVDREVLAEGAGGRQRDRVGVGLVAQCIVELHEEVIAGLERLAARDVSRDLRGADNLARRVTNGRDGERDIEAAAVLRRAHGLKVLDPIPGTEACENLAFLVATLGRDQHGDRLPDRLAGGVAKQMLSACVPGQNDALQGLADDRIV